jgi:hypothetical protein
MVQEVGFAKLQALGIKLIAADSPHSFLDDTPTSKLIRQILGAAPRHIPPSLLGSWFDARGAWGEHTTTALEVHKSLLNVVLHDKPEIKTRDEAISAA